MPDFFVNVTVRMTRWSHGFGVVARVVPLANGMGDPAGVLPVNTCTVLAGDGAAQPLADMRSPTHARAHKPYRVPTFLLAITRCSVTLKRPRKRDDRSGQGDVHPHAATLFEEAPFGQPQSLGDEIRLCHSSGHDVVEDGCHVIGMPPEERRDDLAVSHRLRDVGGADRTSGSEIHREELLVLNRKAFPCERRAG